ncbi:putative acetyltransferase [Renibacterium salmoninarum ATCC 33209]|uniref:Putative acetyltransferase n=1 Tax=Renibacterium salmoninarum (strain ATCC 33209 / DSM 20767 / JCM 11484 / NBRC 15589 / NCIMB 2235) TaxID=288705 RepID=A9WV32_RENSM|nr:GNAT family N-acetyltransferase [Renibacterium salmoninarum]ABY25053.1 putative acetyltransferase [Renibacterium salmoninarum ATCC 33209]
MSKQPLALLDAERQALQTSTEADPLTREFSADGSECRIVFTACAPEAVEETIAAEKQRAQKAGYTLEWKVYGHDSLPKLPELLTQAGFEPDDRETVLALSVDQAMLPADEALDIRQVTDAQGFNDYEEIAHPLGRRNAAQERQRLAAERESHPGEISIHIAYVDGVPRACGRLYLRAGGHVAELAGGRTHPDFRRKGLFTALVASRVLEASDQGRELVLVDALPTSEPILTRLGFEPITWTMPFVFEPDENA